MLFHSGDATAEYYRYLNCGYRLPLVGGTDKMSSAVPVRTIVEGAREYVRHTAVRRPDQLIMHHHGEADHLTWLERPFTEALRALDERGRA